MWLTDTLPAEVTPITSTLAASDGGAVDYTGGEIHWQGTIAAGQSVSVTYSARVHPEVAVDLRPVTNTMVLTHQGTALSRHTSFLLGYARFLPFLEHGGAP